jgi:hypothetical protein
MIVLAGLTCKYFLKAINDGTSGKNKDFHFDYNILPALLYSIPSILK